MEIPKDAKVIGIQLPDGLKPKAFEIVEKLKEKGYEVIVSGESCFGACDIDLNLLKVVDVLLHFVHTPILNIEKVIYVPYKIDYNACDVFDVIKSNVRERRIALISIAQYCHKLKELKKLLEENGYEVELKKGTRRVVYPGQVLGCNYTALRNSKSDAVVFIGDGLFHAIGASIYTGKKVYALNPLSLEIVRVDTSEFLKERYRLISRCVGLKRVGIIVSSKPGQNRFELAKNLLNLAESYNLKAHLIYLNELTPEKLYNLPYEFYVNTACPRISYDDYKNYDKPIITPQEFEILVGNREEYAMDEIE